MHKKTGLSNDAITMLEQAHKQSKDSDFTDGTERIDKINKPEEMDWEEMDKKYPGVNMLGYSKWYLVQKVNDFIFRQMKKHGLKIEL